MTVHRAQSWDVAGLPFALRRLAAPIILAALAAWLCLAACGFAAAQEPAEPIPQPGEPFEYGPVLPPDWPALPPPPDEPDAGPAEGQPEFPGPAVEGPAVPGPAEQPPQPPAPGGPLVLNFRDASVSAVLEFLSEALGLIVVQEARVEGRITVLSYQPVSEDEAIALLDSVLRAKGYAAVRIGRTLKIVTIDQAKKELIPVRSGSDPEEVEPSDRLVTQVIPIRFADAVKLKTDLASLVPAGADVSTNATSNSLILTSTEANIRRIMEIIRAIDVHVSEVSQVKVFQLQNANATSAARLITEIFKQDQTGQQQQPGMPFGFRRAFVAPGQTEASGTDQRSMARVTASADERTNTLVVSAPPDMLKVIEDVVHELDADPAEQQAVFIYPVKNGSAVNMESTLNNLFGTGTGTTRQGTGTQQQTQSVGFGSSAFGSRTSGTSTGSGSSRTTTTSGRTTGTRTISRNVPASTTAAASDLAGKVYVVADEDTNSLLVTTASKNFDRVKAILADLDRPVPQVLIKVLLAEATRDDSLELGAEFSVLNLRASGEGTTAGTDFNVANESGGFITKVLESEVTAAIRALAATAKLDVLSRPYILTSDNQQASILVGQEVPFITSSRTTGETGQTINTIQYDPIGIILNVTPHINPQGIVTLDVAPEISTLTGETVPISETLKAPVFAKRSAQSRVAIRDGQTIVIGGLMEDRMTDSVSKVPVLGDIPVLGVLFRHTVKKKTKTELLIFLTPHVARQPADLEGMSEQELSANNAIKGAVAKGTLEEHLDAMKRGAPVAAPDEVPRDEGPPPDQEEPQETPQEQ